MASVRANYNGGLTPFVIFSCIVAATGGLLFGYDLGVSGGVSSMEPFLRRFFPELLNEMSRNIHKKSNYCKFNSQLLTLFTSSLYLAGVVATVPAAWITRSRGRRASMMVAGFTFFVGSVVGGLAVNIGMLIAGRALLGIGIGFADQAVPLYLSEMAPPRYRGAINNTFGVSVGLGALIANLINYNTEKLHSDKGWRLSLLLGAVPALVLSLGLLFIPDTPNSLIQRTNDMETVRKMLQRLRGTSDIDEELNDIASAGKNSNSRAIMQRKYGPPLIISLFLPFFQKATGINVITLYSPMIFRMIGFGESSSLLSTVITGVVTTCTMLVAVVLVDRLGRRIMFITGGIAMFLTHITVGTLLATELGNYGGMDQGYAYTVLVLVCVYVAGFGISWGPLSWLVPSEILPLEVRSTGQSMFVAVSFSFNFLLAQSLLALLCHMRSGVFFFFGGWVLLMTAFVIVLLPETKNLPIEKVDTVWRAHWLWKSFVGGKDGETDINGATL